MTPRITWAALLDIALCPSLSADSRRFAVDELRKLAAYLDEAVYFDLRELHVSPFSVGKPAASPAEAAE